MPSVAAALMAAAPVATALGGLAQTAPVEAAAATSSGKRASHSSAYTVPTKRIQIAESAAAPDEADEERQQAMEYQEYLRSI